MRQELLPFISTIEVDSEFLMVLKIVRNKNCNDNGIVLSFVYLPPEGSNYSNNVSMLEIEQ